MLFKVKILIKDAFQLSRFAAQFRLTEIHVFKLCHNHIEYFTVQRFNICCTHDTINYNLAISVKECHV